MKRYLITIYERWEHGTQWSYTVHTNGIEKTRTQLKAQYNRFTIEEIDW